MAAVAKDPAIKLFGRTISLPEFQVSDDSESLDNESSMTMKPEAVDCRNENYRRVDEAASLKSCHAEQRQSSITQPNTLKAISEFKTKDEESDGSEELKSSKRPDKILPCPRCNSSDTKFCYFNNYNVNQPRHFCKSCQRYWTAGGTVRNVPVGAGRRRNKHLASQYRQIVGSSDGGSPTLVETPDSTNQLVSCEETISSCTTSSPHEMVLKFGPESPNCNVVPKVIGQNQRNGFSEMDLGNCEYYERGTIPCGSPLTGSSLGTKGNSSDQSLHQPLYHYSVPPPISAVIPNSSCSMPLSVPVCTTPNISVQFVSAPFWNCIPVWVAGSGNISLAAPNGCPPPFCSTGNGLQVLGKHPRDTTRDEVTGQGASLPKTLRIHDLDEA